MKKLLSFLVFTLLLSNCADNPCNSECWKVTDLNIYKVKGSLRITFTNFCNKSFTYNTYVIDESIYHLFSIGDIICKDEFPDKKIGNSPQLDNDDKLTWLYF